MSQPYERPKFRKMADSGLLVEYGSKIDPRINQKVQAARFALESNPPVGVMEIVPAYCSVLIVYDPLIIRCEDLEREIIDLNNSLGKFKVPTTEVIEVPVCYGNEFGPDLHYVAEYSGVAEEEVVQIHSDMRYAIYMLGFTPGFPFLGGLSEKLHTPRLDSPRTSVPEGAVGIANNQTGIYPIESPGGWQIIGRTPLKLFDPTRTSPFLFKAGDTLKFKPISVEQFYKMIEDISV